MHFLRSILRKIKDFLHCITHPRPGPPPQSENTIRAQAQPDTKSILKLNTTETKQTSPPRVSPKFVEPEPEFEITPRDPAASAKPILSIDLDAAYTKVSFRPGLNVGHPFDEESQILVLNGQHLIPSIVVQDSNGRQYFGRTAAGLNPLGRKVVQNWKKDLLDRQSAPDSRRRDRSRGLTPIRLAKRRKNLW